jgi:ribonuclease HI
MNNRNSTLLLIGLLLMTIVAGIFGYLYFQERNTAMTQQVDLEVRVIELATAEIKLDSISKQLEMRIQEIKGLDGDISALQKAKSEIDNDRVKLRSNSAMLHKKIQEFEALLQQKDLDILDLRNKNQQLLTENEQLTQENLTIGKAHQRIQDSLVLTEQQKQELQFKVSQAAVLRAQNIEVYAISAKGKVREGDGVKSKRIDKIRIDFTLDKNILVSTGLKKLYIRILDPTGAIESNEATGSGIFIYQGKELRYTSFQEIQFTNDNQKLSILHTQDNPFSKGNHRIEIYAEGSLIGESSFSVK